MLNSENETSVALSFPKIIQGGMGAGVSGWRLARAVSELGQLGVVSGTALAVILVGNLQPCDPGGEVRHALSHFPVRDVAARLLAEHFIPGGKLRDEPFKLPPMPTLRPSATGNEVLCQKTRGDVTNGK